jgi:microcystin-dependent protein
MIDFAGTSAPSGWLLCDGASYLRASYTNLFTAIGTTWGSIDGSHFNVPNMSRRVGMGSGGSGTATIGNAVGNTGGEETHTLITAEMPSHTHTASVTDPGHTHVVPGHDNDGSGSNRYAGALSSAAPSGVQSTANSHATGITVGNSSTGGDGAHNNVQPAAIVLKIIKI